VIGEYELGAKDLALFQSSPATGHIPELGSSMIGFFQFCEESAIPPPLDITNIDIALYLAWMGDKGTVAADNMQPYLSAINKFLLDHGMSPVALGPMVTGVRKLLANCQKDLAPTAERLPLPAPVALAILEKAEELIKGVQWAAHDCTNNMLMRACTVTITSYVFFCRGECGVCARGEDLIVNTTHITLRLSKEKGCQLRLGFGYRL
jgi:hypothetical protein